MRRPFFLLLIALVILSLSNTRMEGSSAVGLQGIVSSEAEGPMEGVLVNAKRVGGTITVTVVSDRQGYYRFPMDRLSPGKYDLSMWAVGYDALEKRGVEVVLNKTNQVDLRIEKLEDKTKLAMQLSHTEWEMTLGNPKIRACGGCHVIGYVMTKTYEPDEWEQVIYRMKNHGEGSAFRRHGITVVRQPYEVPLSAEDKELAQYLSSVAGGRKLGELKFKTLPRPTGTATRVILTSYELAREDSAPHDVAVDSEGIVWHSEITLPYLGKLDPKTGKTELYRIPENKKGFPPGTFDVEFDQEGNPWFGLLWQSGIGKLDKKTGKVSLWKLSPEWDTEYSPTGTTRTSATAMIAVGSPDGKVWFSNNALKNFHRLDPKTGEIENIPHPDKKKSTYGITVDSKGNAWFAGLADNSFGKVDAKTGKVTYYTPPTPDSGPRRIQADSRDRIWFAEYRANKVAVFDPETERFREWILPSPYAGSYDVAPANNGEVVWISGNYDDRIYRLDTRTGQITTYAWPRPFPNVQRLSIDNTQDTTKSVWVAEDNYGIATKLEVLALEE